MKGLLILAPCLRHDWHLCWEMIFKYETKLTLASLITNINYLPLASNMGSQVKADLDKVLSLQGTFPLVTLYMQGLVVFKVHTNKYKPTP